MVIFNDPFPCDDPAGGALRLALAMREKMAEIREPVEVLRVAGARG